MQILGKRLFLGGGVAVLLVIAASCGGGSGDTPAGDPGDPTVEHLEAELAFYQLDMKIGSGVDWQHTGWGVVRIRFQADPGLWFLNLVIQDPANPSADLWQVQNLPILSQTTASGSTTQELWVSFALPVALGTPFPSMWRAWSLTNVGIVEAPANWLQVQLATESVLFWGGEIGAAFVPVNAPLLNPLFPFIKILKSGSVDKALYPNQEQGNNECVPGAISNSLKYLNAKHALGLTDGQTSINTVKGFTGWGAGGAPTGPAGSAWWDLKSAGVAGAPYNITTTVNAQDGTEADRISDFDQMIDDLNAGKDVELRIPGHAACVTGATKYEVGGKILYAVQITHDTKQGMAGGTKTETAWYDPATNTYSGNWSCEGAMHDRFVTER